MEIRGLAFSVVGLRRDANEIEACGGGNEAAHMRWAATEIERLRKIETAATNLWNAHCKSHDAQPSPQKFAMNYGELVKLAQALGIVEDRGDGGGGERQVTEAEDRIITPILSVEVAALLCMCGICGHRFTVEHEALDQESGKVDSAHDFGDCPECGEAFDAQAARFTAHLADE